MGSIVPAEGQRPACAQVYILDSASQLEVRRGLPWGGVLRSELLTALRDMLEQVNPFVKVFQRAATDTTPELHLSIVAAPRLGEERR